ncbi:cell division protein DivIB [Barrientosiimonas marina]|uniref:Cell division protein DivIB n=2 Tax=Lentibacillus kimchii TaxID=1542911 RepID=A0ABW2URI9_9BACI
MGKKNVVSIEDRIPTLKQERKKKANRRLIFYLSLFFILIAVIVYLQSPLSDIKTINASGNSIVEESKVIDISGIQTGTNIWTVDKTDAREKLQENPVIQEAEVNRDLPWTVDIKVTEVNFVGSVKRDNEQIPISGNGKLLQDTDQTSIGGNVPFLIDFTEEDHLQQMAKELGELPAAILNLISEIHWQPTDNNQDKITLFMNDGYTVDSTIRHFADNMRVYPSIVQQLESASDEGIIHIGEGVYFEKFDSEHNAEISDNNSDNST